MDRRITRFRDHLRRLASTAVPSYADCVVRGTRSRRVAHAGLALGGLVRGSWPGSAPVN